MSKNRISFINVEYDGLSPRMMRYSVLGWTPMALATAAWLRLTNRCRICSIGVIFCPFGNRQG